MRHGGEPRVCEGAAQWGVAASLAVGLGVACLTSRSLSACPLSAVRACHLWPGVLCLCGGRAAGQRGGGGSEQDSAGTLRMAKSEARWCRSSGEEYAYRTAISSLAAQWNELLQPSCPKSCTIAASSTASICSGAGATPRKLSEQVSSLPGDIRQPRERKHGLVQCTYGSLMPNACTRPSLYVWVRVCAGALLVSV